MGTDYFPCSSCGDCFPDCIDYGRCENCSAYFCECCWQKVKHLVKQTNPDSIEGDTALECTCCSDSAAIRQVFTDEQLLEVLLKRDGLQREQVVDMVKATLV